MTSRPSGFKDPSGAAIRTGCAGTARQRRVSYAPLLLTAVTLTVASSYTCGVDSDSSPDPATERARTVSSVLRVGPSRAIATIAEAARSAHDGDVVEIDGGTYVGDVAVWTQRNLTIRGANGRPRLVAGGAAAEDKAIWVVRGDHTVIENVSFEGARVADQNGAGIRHERGRLVVRNCAFHDNEDGILTANDPAMELEIEDSVFADDGAGDGYSHALYAGTIGRLTVRGSYFTRGRAGHLIKSRARESLILYNRITDETGTASYEVEFPVGGAATVLGNLIQQSPKTENPIIVSFGAEGYRWEPNALTLAYNTIVNDRRENATFVAAWPGAASVRMLNNLFVGGGDFGIQVPAESLGNAFPGRSEFMAPSEFDYRLRAGSRLVGTARDSAAELKPSREYVHPAKSVTLEPAFHRTRLNPGAFQRLGR